MAICRCQLAPTRPDLPLGSLLSSDLRKAEGANPRAAARLKRRRPQTAQHLPSPCHAQGCCTHAQRCSASRVSWLIFFFCPPQRCCRREGGGGPATARRHQLVTRLCLCLCGVARPLRLPSVAVQCSAAQPRQERTNPAHAF